MLGEPIGVYKFEDKATSEVTTTHIFKGPKIGKGRIVVLDTLAVVDYTTSNKKLLVGRNDITEKAHYVHADQYTGIFETHLRGKMILLEGEAPIGVVESPTAADVMYFSAYGLIYKLP